MASKKGTLLERNTQQLLTLSGFSPQTNKIVDSYEIDVYLEYNNKKIAFECKQYERSTLAVRNLIHQWHSKKALLCFDRIVLVIVGIDISPQDYRLAKEYGVIIWDENKFMQLFDMAIHDKISNKSVILTELDIRPQTSTLKESNIKSEFSSTKEKNPYWVVMGILFTIFGFKLLFNQPIFGFFALLIALLFLFWA
jgi:uncharacterized membrane protein (Fun14 family)